MSREDVLTWIARYASAMLDTDQVADLSRRVDDAIIAEIPGISDDAAFLRDLHTSTYEAARTYFTHVAHDPAQPINIPPASQGLFRALAQRGLELGVLLRIFPAGLRVAWQTMMSAALADDIDEDLRKEILEYAWEHISRTIDAWTHQGMAAYLDEAQARISGAAARRIQTVHAILRGEEVDPEGATRALGHNLYLRQTCLVLWAANEVEPAEAVAALESLARDVATALNAARPITVASGPRTIWAWVATPGDPDLRNVLSSALFRGRAALRAALGVPAAGVDGFRTSHAEAVLAQKVAMESESPVPATFYRDVELVSFVASNPMAMRTFVARELGELAQPGPATARLRETLTVYLKSGSSARAAEELGVHKNTILYRLQQAEELLGHAVDERRLPLEVALHVTAVYRDNLL